MSWGRPGEGREKEEKDERGEERIWVPIVPKCGESITTWGRDGGTCEGAVTLRGGLRRPLTRQTTRTGGRLRRTRDLLRAVYVLGSSQSILGNLKYIGKLIRINTPDRSCFSPRFGHARRTGFDL